MVVDVVADHQVAPGVHAPGGGAVVGQNVAALQLGIVAVGDVVHQHLAVRAAHHQQAVVAGGHQFVGVAVAAEPAQAETVPRVQPGHLRGCQRIAHVDHLQPAVVVGGIEAVAQQQQVVVGDVGERRVLRVHVVGQFHRGGGVGDGDHPHGAGIEGQVKQRVVQRHAARVGRVVGDARPGGVGQVLAVVAEGLRIAHVHHQQPVLHAAQVGVRALHLHHRAATGEGRVRVLVQHLRIGGVGHVQHGQRGGRVVQLTQRQVQQGVHLFQVHHLQPSEGGRVHAPHHHGLGGHGDVPDEEAAVPAGQVHVGPPEPVDAAAEHRGAEAVGEHHIRVLVAPELGERHRVDLGLPTQRGAPCQQTCHPPCHGLKVAGYCRTSTGCRSTAMSPLPGRKAMVPTAPS